MRSFALALLLTTTVLTATASAAQMSTFNQARQVAATYFTPSCGAPVLRWSDFMPDGSPAQAPGGAVIFWGAYAVEDQCAVTFSWASWRWTGRAICDVMVHEYGHLAGLEHSDDPRSVMHVGAVSWPRRCALAFRR